MTILAFAGIIAGADIAVAHSELGPALLCPTHLIS